MESSLISIAEKLRDVNLELEDKRGELAEVLKAEAEAKSIGFQNSAATTDTGRRAQAEAQALPFTLETHDLRADIASLETWVQFYTLLIKHDLVIELEGCPPKRER